LVALIITIIVMLILVGVTINLAVNGGIFDKAREGVQRTKEEVINDELTASLYVDNKGYVDVYTTYITAKDLFASENKTIEVTDPTDQTQITEGMDKITIKVENAYIFTIAKDGITRTNE